jgi:DNA modification methylase
MDTGPMTVRILTGDALTVLRTLPDASVNCCVTSPPYYGLRDYGMEGQIGLEETPDAYVAKMVAVLSEVRRVLRDDGTLWLNIGDSYAGGGNYRGVSSEATLSAKQRSNGGARGVSQLLGAKNTPGCKPKDLIGIPWMLAFALRADGWYLRKDIIWHKPNPMPESVRDRPTSAHEYLFLLAKSSVYHYDADAIAEDAIYSGLTGQDESGFKNPANFAGKHSCESPRGEKADKQRGHSRRHAGFNDRWDQMEKSEQCSGKRNKRSVWTIATKPFAEAHFATMAPELAETCIKAGCPIGGTVLDPFGGAGTTGLMADRLGRNATLIELNPAYVEIARKRLSDDAGMFAEVA